MSRNNRTDHFPTQHCNSSVNIKRLAHELGAREKGLRRWLRDNHYKRKKGSWLWSEADAQQVIGEYRARKGGEHA